MFPLSLFISIFCVQSYLSFLFLIVFSSLHFHILFPYYFSLLTFSCSPFAISFFPSFSLSSFLPLFCNLLLIGNSLTLKYLDASLFVSLLLFSEICKPFSKSIFKPPSLVLPSHLSSPFPTRLTLIFFFVLIPVKHLKRSDLLFLSSYHQRSSPVSPLPFLSD